MAKPVRQGMPLLVAVVVVCAAYLLTACAGGLVDMKPEQLKANAGNTGCSSAKTLQGSVTTIIVGVDDVRRGASGKSKVTISPDCNTVIETEITTPAPGVQPVVRAASGVDK